MSIKSRNLIILTLLVILILFSIGISIYYKTTKSEEKQDTFPYLLSENCEILVQDINEGMTIKDEYGNEWVWIVVPKTQVFLEAKDKYDYENIEKDIQEYTKDYLKENYEDYSQNQQYIELKEKNLSSIYEYGGFWISRYEIGTTQLRNTKDAKITEPFSKPDLYVYNYITFEQAKELATTISNKNYTSNLLFGFECNLVCKFMEQNGYTNNKEKITKPMITGNSSLWGNYYSSSFEINRGKYTEDGNKYYNFSDIGEKRAYRNLLLTTGASEQNKVCNIYDFAGNVSEWILEYAKDDKSMNIIRDGSFYFNYGGNDPANGRYRVTPNSSSSNYGFRAIAVK